MGYFIFSPFIILIPLFGYLAFSIYQATSWAAEMMESLLAKLSSPPAPMLMPIMTSFAPPPTMAPPGSGPSTEVTEQLVKLADLHKAGVLTEFEYADKMAQLLKRK